MEWKLFSNLFSTSGNEGKENPQPIPNTFSTGYCIFYPPLVAGMMCPKGLMVLQKCSLLVGFNADTRMEPWFCSSLDSRAEPKSWHYQMEQRRRGGLFPPAETSQSSVSKMPSVK